MPAIDLARLRKQVSHLADRFDDPESFMRALRDVLDEYTNHTLRTAERTIPGSALPTYRTPQPVLKHLQRELTRLAQDKPLSALALADRLWQEGWLETSLLAAMLLGDVSPREERLLPRLTAWTQHVRDPNVRAVLLDIGLQRLRREMPERFLALIAEWLHPERPRLWANGIQALLPLLQEGGFDHLPKVFEMLRSVIQAAPTAIQGDLVDLLQALYRLSAVETVHFLRQTIQSSPHSMTVVTLRRIAPALPSELVAQLRDLLRPAQGR